MRSDAATDRAVQDAAPDEAARWVQDALENARTWFPDLTEEELREPLEQAFELASRTGRGEREFHSVFEAEARRAIEERDFVGSSDSVLPTQSSAAPRPFQSVAAVPEPEPEPEPDPEPEPEPSRSRSWNASPSRLKRARAPPADEYDEDRARAFGLAVGALRFQEGLSPEDIQDGHGIGADYYGEVMEWLLAEADRSLSGTYPAHLNRDRMARFAAGLQDVGASIATERHIRDCAGCAAYLTDLLEVTVRLVGGGEPREDAAAETAQRKPVVRIQATELRPSRRRPEPTPARRARRRRPSRPPSRRPAPSRSAGGAARPRGPHSTATCSGAWPRSSSSSALP